MALEKQVLERLNKLFKATYVKDGFLGDDGAEREKGGIFNPYTHYRTGELVEVVKSYYLPINILPGDVGVFIGYARPSGFARIGLLDHERYEFLQICELHPEQIAAYGSKKVPKLVIMTDRAGYSSRTGILDGGSLDQTALDTLLEDYPNLPEINELFGSEPADHDSAMGYLKVLYAFCKEAPEFHIATQVPNGEIYNRPRPGANRFFLAKGDRNEMLCHHPLTIEGVLEDYIAARALVVPTGRQYLLQTFMFRFPEFLLELAEAEAHLLLESSLPAKRSSPKKKMKAKQIPVAVKKRRPAPQAERVLYA